MSQVKLTISTKNLDTEVKYHSPSQQISFEEHPRFLVPDLPKEVNQLTKKKKRNYARICKVTITTALSLFALASPTFAATTAVAQTAEILPADIIKIGMYLIGLCAAASTVLAIILSQLAGGYRMLRKGKEATEWTTDILKGYTQVILAPVIIVSIAFVVYLLFGNFEWFVKPF